MRILTNLPALDMSPRFLTKLLICFVVSGANSHCRPVAKQPVNRSFYYWKSVFALSADERNQLSALKVTRMYVRFFDVTWDRQTGMAVPTAAIRFKDTFYPGYNIIPVVFISNEVFARLNSPGIAVLAASTAALVRQLGDDNHLPQPDEFQLDCDYSRDQSQIFLLFDKYPSSPERSRATIMSAVRYNPIVPGQIRGSDRSPAGGQGVVDVLQYGRSQEHQNA